MTSEHLRAQRSSVQSTEPEPAQPEAAQPDAVRPGAVQPGAVGAGPRRVMAPQAPAALGGMGSTGPITLVPKNR